MTLPAYVPADGGGGQAHPSPRGDLCVVGDSITNQAEGDAVPRFTQAGWHTSWSGIGNAHTVSRRDDLLATPTHVSGLTSTSYPTVFANLLGTNDCQNLGDAKNYDGVEAAQRILWACWNHRTQSGVGTRCVVMTVSEQTDVRTINRTASRYNDHVRDVARRHFWLGVVDWARINDEHGASAVTSDGVHPNQYGRDLLLDALEATIDRLLEV